MELIKTSILDPFMLKEGRNFIKQHQLSLIKGKEVVVSLFEERDFTEFQLSISNFVFTRKNFNIKLDYLLETVNQVFSRNKYVEFATGIYQVSMS